MTCSRAIATATQLASLLPALLLLALTTLLPSQPVRAQPTGTESPAITTQASAGISLGGSITDTATVAPGRPGDPVPTGFVRFRV